MTGTLNISNIDNNLSGGLNIGQTATLINIGSQSGTTNAVINIGGTNDTVNITGTTNYIQSTNTQISNKTITLNEGENGNN